MLRASIHSIVKIAVLAPVADYETYDSHMPEVTGSGPVRTNPGMQRFLAVPRGPLRLFASTRAELFICDHLPAGSLAAHSHIQLGIAVSKATTSPTASSWAK